MSSASSVHCGLACCCFSTGRPHFLSHLTHAHQQHVGRLLIFSIHSWWVFISFPLHCSASTIFAIGVSLSHLLQGLLILLGLNLPEAFGPRAQHATDPYPSVWQLARLKQDPGIQLAMVTEHIYLLWQATYISEYVTRHCVLPRAPECSLLNREVRELAGGVHADEGQAPASPSPFQSPFTCTCTS